MIKFFQKLKAKKGFTLVELIVVIAIIGVLAAILVPTMLGYVTNSRVTSANSTAASIKNNIDTFLTNADTAGYGMKQGAGVNQEIDIQIENLSGVFTWKCTAATAGSFKSGGSSVAWGTAASGVTKDTEKAGEKSAEKLLLIELAALFPEIATGSIHAVLNGGKCVAVAYTADDSAVLATGTDCPAVITNATTGAMSFDETYEWDKKTNGVNAAGLIVGTAPVVLMN